MLLQRCPQRREGLAAAAVLLEAAHMDLRHRTALRHVEPADEARALQSSRLKRVLQHDALQLSLLHQVLLEHAVAFLPKKYDARHTLLLHVTLLRFLHGRDGHLDVDDLEIAANVIRIAGVLELERFTAAD